jgi:hypothetical protein
MIPEPVRIFAIFRPSTAGTPPTCDIHYSEKSRIVGLSSLSGLADNAARTHLSLAKATLIQRAVSSVARIQAHPVLSGLLHQYARI